MKKDNSTFSRKVALRQLALRQVVDPVVLETHGGYGKLFTACYSHIQTGIVIEKDDAKVEFLAQQRPTWSVYQADCETALRAGVGSHLVVNLLDVDPYGDPWPIIDAFFASDRPRPVNLVVVVNDGLRQYVRSGQASKTPTLEALAIKYGNKTVHDEYLAMCRALMSEKAAQVDYRLSRFTGYYCGTGQQMTHYLAVLVNDRSAG